MSIADPDDVAGVASYMSRTSKAIMLARHGGPEYDYDAFFEDWKLRVRTLRIALRRDLDRSVRSLGQAVRLSREYANRRPEVATGQPPALRSAPIRRP